MIEPVSSKPRWSLLLVKGLFAEGRVALTQRARVWFPTFSEALLAVSEVFSSLTLADFAHSAVLRDHVADVYGVEHDGRGWYFKISVDEGEDGRAVIVISFHPLEETLRTRGGLVMP